MVRGNIWPARWERRRVIRGRFRLSGLARFIPAGGFWARTKPEKLNSRVFLKKAMHALMTFDFSAFAGDVWPIIFPMMVGCVPLLCCCLDRDLLCV